MRKMNENATITGIRTRLFIKLLKVYLVYTNERHKWKELWRCTVTNIRNR